MKSLSQYIQEKLVPQKGVYKYFPKTREELREIVEQRMKKEGPEVDLNDVDVSEITNMSYLFQYTNFNGNISGWNVSKVTDMSHMFDGCKSFNQNLSRWNVSRIDWNKRAEFFDSPIDYGHRPRFDQ